MTSAVGLGYWLWNSPVLRYEEFTGVPNVGTPRENLAAFGAPMR